MLSGPNLITPFEIVASGLDAEDERSFWQTALSVLTGEFLQRRSEHLRSRDWAMVVGVCSHWVRPNKGRWLAAGGLAFPEGYKDSMPELDWSVVLLFRDESWIPVPKLPGKRITTFRIAIPARTTRHQQAVVHTRWLPGEEVVFYGFRKLKGEWRCIATSDEASRGRLLAAAE